MRLPWFAVRPLMARAVGIVLDRKPDQVVAGDGGDYLRRWYLTPWSFYDRAAAPRNWIEALQRKLPAVYLHKFLRSDDARALHDHRSWNISIPVMGSYVEHTIAAGGVHERKTYRAGDVKFRRAKAAHRIEIELPCLSIFITGPDLREWGFHCPQGWRHWREFVAGDGIGRGCE